MIEGAFAAAQLGYAIFPIKPLDKRPPPVKGGFYAATRDTMLIRSWWRRWPTANIATRTGDGWAVIDVDPRHGGTLEAVADLGLPLDTRTVRTAGGGWQLHVRVDGPVKSSIGAHAPGIDVKADLGYVLLPPSVRRDGAYTWLTAAHTPMALADAAILSVTRVGHTQVGQSCPRGVERKLPEDIRLGEVHNQIISWAAWLEYQGHTEDEAAAVLERFVERIPVALDRDDTLDDIEKCLRWVYSRASEGAAA